MFKGKITGSTTLIQSMINQGIKYVFGIPDDKINYLFRDIQNSNDPRTPKLIVTRHEQTAAFIAAGIGRLTGKPGVVIASSNSGVANLIPALLEATSNGDPLIVLGGQISRDDVSHDTKQNVDESSLLEDATKLSQKIEDSNDISEGFTNAYLTSVSPKMGATFISLSQNVLENEVTKPVVDELPTVFKGSSNQDSVGLIANLLLNANFPVILLGRRTANKKVSSALHELLNHLSVPVIETLQASGVVSRDLNSNYFGRIGFFNDHISQQILRKSDLILTIGYNQNEVKDDNWHQREAQIIDIDSVNPEIMIDYQPQVIVNADIADTLFELALLIPEDTQLDPAIQNDLNQQQKIISQPIEIPSVSDANGIHPLAVINELQSTVNDQTTVIVDAGISHHWMARYFKAYEPNRLIFSDPSQSQGVALPLAISATLVRPGQHVISISEDKVFWSSGQEIETAVRLNLPVIQIILVKNYYEKVGIQEHDDVKNVKIKLGYIDALKYAESFGAQGFRARNVEQFSSALHEAKQTDGPSIIEVPISF